MSWCHHTWRSTALLPLSLYPPLPCIGLVPLSLCFALLIALGLPTQTSSCHMSLASPPVTSAFGSLTGTAGDWTHGDTALPWLSCPLVSSLWLPQLNYSLGFWTQIPNCQTDTMMFYSKTAFREYTLFNNIPHFYKINTRQVTYELLMIFHS